MPTIFQFQYGSIKSDEYKNNLDFDKIFQFQYGSIKSFVEAVNQIVPSYFNSNMVRLKEFHCLSFSYCATVFQFQYGSIKSFFSLMSISFDTIFQFQYGSIKRTTIVKTKTAILVFQFQYGSIKSRWF